MSRGDNVHGMLGAIKGAGSYLAGMAVAIPILNVDGRRHTNNFSKNIYNLKNINFKVLQLPVFLPV